MADVYASAVGTTVLQIKEIPLRPTEYDGMLALFGLVEDDEAVVRTALERFGPIASCELASMPPLVVFASHEAAREVRRKAEAAAARCVTAEDTCAAITAAIGLHCEGVDTWFNERSYDGRTEEDGYDADEGRGW
jgi:hypothetical protein